MDITNCVRAAADGTRIAAKCREGRTLDWDREYYEMPVANWLN